MNTQLTKNDLIQLLTSYTAVQLRDLIEDAQPIDILEAILEYDGDIKDIINKLPSETIVKIINVAEPEDKYTIYRNLTESEKTSVPKKMASDELVDFLECLDRDIVTSIIEKLDKDTAAETRKLMGYGPESAGGIMATEFVSIREEMTVWETIHQLQKEGKEAESINYLYVLDENGKLKGTLSLHTLVTTDFNEKIANIMNEKVISVPLNMDQEEVARLFQRYGFTSMPVVDTGGKVQGIITYDDIMDVLRDENTEDFEKMAAIIYSDEEYLDTTIFGLAKKRITWLLFLMISATFTGIIIQYFEDAITSVVLLAAFIPMLMDTGGNAGSQSATLIIRGMALGEVRVKDYLTVLFKELRVSIVVGIVLGIINFGRILIMNRDILLAFTVSSALMFTVVLAKGIGCMLPLLAKRLSIDPAVMAAPIITTIVDALSLIVYFSLATLILQIP